MENMKENRTCAVKRSITTATTTRTTTTEKNPSYGPDPSHLPAAFSLPDKPTDSYNKFDTHGKPQTGGHFCHL
jgi:hypothetical protein